MYILLSNTKVIYIILGVLMCFVVGKVVRLRPLNVIGLIQQYWPGNKKLNTIVTGRPYVSNWTTDIIYFLVFLYFIHFVLPLPR